MLERGSVWILLGALSSGATLALIALVLLGLVPGVSRALRGYTTLGVLLGLAAVLLSLASFYYSLRKRLLQEQLVLGRGSLASWLWAHLFFGTLGLVLAFVHAGYGGISSQLSSGKLLLLLLVLVVVGGLFWRLIYGVLPRAAAREVNNYSRLASRRRAEACRVEIEKIAAGRSPRFRELAAWIEQRRPGPAELDAALQGLAVEEHQSFAELAELSRARAQALEREGRQARFLRLLQGMRILHVPLSLLFLALIPVHVLFAYDLPARLIPPGRIGGAALGGFEPATTCASCHRSIYREWQGSMHAHAMVSPVMIAQTNQVARRVLAGIRGNNLGEICVNCHGPVGALLTQGNTLPLPEQTLSSRALLQDGISCAVCHQWEGQSETGGAGLAHFQEGLLPGRTYLGPRVDPSGNAFHRSRAGKVFQRPEELCRNCHSVQYDKNRDGRFDRGTDLVLQTLFDEWEAYARTGGASCLDCHMPPSGKTRSADGARIPFEQDEQAPPRAVRDHSFVAVDYPLEPTLRDASRPRREALLRRAATLSVASESIARSPRGLSFVVEIQNSGTGHNLPGGFAFVRQMWIEVLVRDAAGRELASSGRLSRPDHDLCDASIVGDSKSPIRAFLRGCAQADPSLVSFQQMLVDRATPARDTSGAFLLGSRGERLLTKAEGAKEVVIQHLEGGPVPRLRPVTKKPTAPLAPGESARFPYQFELSGEPRSLSVRLLFRATAPYFLRALGAEQPPGEAERLDALTGYLEVTEMAKVEITL